MDNTVVIIEKVERGLDFVLKHLEQQQSSLFPRAISTKATNNGQIIVYSKADAMNWFAISEFIDCRISAYPYNYSDNLPKLITFVLVDLDLKTFGGSKKKLDKYLFGKLLPNMKKQHGIEPSVIWSGNGYHVYIEIEPLPNILENIEEFTKFKNPSKQMLKYLERYFSGGKCDYGHNCSVSFTNCMLRVPGSFNSKRDRADKLGEVKVIKEHSLNNNERARFPIKSLFGDFIAYLLDSSFSSTSNYRKLLKKDNKTHSLLFKNANNNNLATSISEKIDWIEVLLQMQIGDFRKYCIWRILAPYLINKRKLDYDTAYDIIEDWLLNKCDKLEPLDFDTDYKIDEGLNGVESTGCYPIAFRDLKLEQPELYKIIWNKIRHIN